MNKKVRELLVKKDELTAEMRNFLEANKVQEAEEKAQEIRKINLEIECIQEEERSKEGNPVTTEKKPNVSQLGEVRAFTKEQPMTAAYKNDRSLSLGAYLKGALTGNWEGAESENEEFRALSTATGNVLIPTELFAQVVDLSRNKSIFLNSNIPVIPMDSNNLTIAKVEGDPNFKFKAELEEAEYSDMTFTSIDLKSKTAYGIVKMSIETLKSAKNIDAVVNEAMSKSVAQMIDQAFLLGNTTGTDTFEPTGILNSTDINVVEGGAVGTNKYSDFVKAVGKIRSNNGEPKEWAINSEIDEKLNLLTNTLGDPLGVPKVLEGLNQTISNQLPSNLGTGLDESVSLIYDPAALVVGMQVQPEIEILRSPGVKDGSVTLRIVAMLDCQAIKPKHITKITKLK